jgi:uncharacterized protein (TIGR02118 family)
MIKWIGLIKRKPGITEQAFSKYWKDIHAAVVLKNMPGVVRYIQNHRIKINEYDSAWDGIVELWFEDLESFRSMSRWYLSEAGKILRDDEDKFIDRSKTIDMICEEAVIK